MKCLNIAVDGTVSITDDVEACTGYLVLEVGESASALPPLTVAQAEEIAGAFLIALASIVAIKVAFKLSR